MSEVSDESRGLRPGWRYGDQREDGTWPEPPQYLKDAAHGWGFEFRRRSSGMWVSEVK